MEKSSTLEKDGQYIKVVLPLAIEQSYTYSVPEEFQPWIQYGVRVEVQFGKKRHYAALVVETGVEAPDYAVKPIRAVLDTNPVIHPLQYPFWKWIADYYMSPLGDVMNASLPASLKLTSETYLLLNEDYDGDTLDLGDEAYLVAEALQIHQELSIEEVRTILQKKSVYPAIQELIECGFLVIKEELKERFKPRREDFLRLTEPYASQPAALHDALDATSRSEKQTRALLAMIQESKKGFPIHKLKLQKAQNVDHATWTALQKKGLIEIFTRTTSRLQLDDTDAQPEALPPFNKAQADAHEKISSLWSQHRVVLLHGVTGSGKTRIYKEWMKKWTSEGKQVLYLLPEIALTTHLIQRLQTYFGKNIGVYHSHLSNNERVEMWKAVRNGLPIVLGARSALFLPFEKLGGIVIDEEHDPSYKQYDPSPRYHSRDAAIYLASLWDIPVLMGSATPSIESFHNAESGKYGLVRLENRYGDILPPDITLVDLSEERRKKRLDGHFSRTLIDAIELCLKENKQTLIFKNRRGYAPTLQCDTCGWHSECVHCDVTMTYHRFHGHLRCHYCGYKRDIPDACPACGNKQLEFKGFGTEQIEEELKTLFPEARIGRMDIDTVRTRSAFEKVFEDLEMGRTQILVGTQMLSKGLDFENIGLVGVMSAEQSLFFPDFRSTERTFQLLTQVSGRAGRKHRQGKVIIQTNYYGHDIFQKVLDADYMAFYKQELSERREYAYPPFVRIIKVTLKHPKAETVYQAAQLLSQMLMQRHSKRILGPAAPVIPRIRNQYLQDLIIKMERKTPVIHAVKADLEAACVRVKKTRGFTSVRINIDVDPN